MENLPDSIKKRETILHLDLILDGGMFNGSYLIGALYFLKELEKRKFIKIDRISGCSIGSICALLYFLDELDMVTDIYTILTRDLRESHHANKLKELGLILKDKIPKDIGETLKDKLFISFYNVKTQKKSVKCRFESKEEVIDVVIRSCFIPFFIDGCLFYKKKYMDGMNPAFFPVTKENICKNKINRKDKKSKKTLYLDLFGYDKLFLLFNVKNEKTNFHRILSGLLDIHNFFIKQSSTSMCSFVEDWGYLHWIHRYQKVVIEFLVFHSLVFFLYFKNYFLWEFNDFLLFRLFSKILYEGYISLLDSYFL